MRTKGVSCRHIIIGIGATLGSESFATSSVCRVIISPNSLHCLIAFSEEPTIVNLYRM